MTLPELVKDYTEKQRADEREWERFTRDWPRLHGKYELLPENDLNRAAFRVAKERWRKTLAAKDAAYNDLVAAEKLLKDNAFDAVSVVSGLVAVFADVRVDGLIDSFTLQPARELLAKVGHLIPKPETPCPASTTSPSTDTTPPPTPPTTA